MGSALRGVEQVFPLLLWRLVEEPEREELVCHGAADRGWDKKGREEEEEGGEMVWWRGAATWMADLGGTLQAGLGESGMEQSKHRQKTSKERENSNVRTSVVYSSFESFMREDQLQLRHKFPHHRGGHLDRNLWRFIFSSDLNLVDLRRQFR
nr:PREDICTED: uncharacterized protein LOC106702269 [Latimeria chalumnae]|eukprot:XP_014339905.1 PREDICTED: uncharacterized protein LOC106702269 [Latimeria chalumnae]